MADAISLRVRATSTPIFIMEIYYIQSNSGKEIYKITIQNSHVLETWITTKNKHVYKYSLENWADSWNTKKKGFNYRILTEEDLVLEMI